MMGQSPYPNLPPLRCATAGSVDDGKSTLIGRLLLDARALMTDQLDHIEQASARRGLARTDLALVTDGLRAEREQGITIDVAWRYFATPRRRFILADAPGHVQYTRNMVTACAGADAAIVLVDGRRQGAAGTPLAEQTRRHLFIARLLGVRSLVVLVNKLDAVDEPRRVFEKLTDDVERFLARLPPAARPSETHFVPISALAGDNVVEPSASMDWYRGPTVLSLLESLPAGDVDRRAPARLPIQWTVRPHREDLPDYRGYAGRLASGTLGVGDRVVALPSGRSSRVRGIETLSGEGSAAVAGESIIVQLDDELDLERGELLVRADEASPAVVTDWTADLAWLDDAPARTNGTYLVKHGTREVRATLSEVIGHYDVETGALTAPDASGLARHGLGKVRMRAFSPLAVDAFDTHATTGSFLLIDPASGDTLAGGMIRATHGG
jgi:sulfate adenylyltransferase subunit 1